MANKCKIIFLLYNPVRYCYPVLYHLFYNIYCLHHSIPCLKIISQICIAKAVTGGAVIDTFRGVLLKTFRLYVPTFEISSQKELRGMYIVRIKTKYKSEFLAGHNSVQKSSSPVRHIFARGNYVLKDVLFVRKNIFFVEILLHFSGPQTNKQI